MDKNFITTKDDPIIKLNQEGKTVEIAIRDFYSNGTVSNFSFSPEQNTIVSLYALTKMPAPLLALTQDQLRERCEYIRYNVKRGISGYIEIQLNKGHQMSNKIEYPLENTLLKITPLGADGPKHFFIKAGDTLDAFIFLGDGIGGVMLVRDEKGNEKFIQLYEFYLLSLRTVTDPTKEIGLMTSFTAFLFMVHTSTILASNLGPVKTLLLSDFLQSEWQRSKDATTESSDKEAGGEING